jgi:anthrone oxygenase-like protein
LWQLLVYIFKLSNCFCPLHTIFTRVVAATLQSKKVMKQILLFTSISLASGLLLMNIYNSMIDTRSWGSNIPVSIETARNYYKTVNPGNFYRIFSPLNQILALVLVILFWKVSPNVRWTLAAACVLYVITDVFTFAYFYPRNDIMFKTGSLTDIETLKRVWGEWNMMNWVRSGILAIGVVCSWAALHRAYLLK